MKWNATPSFGPGLVMYHLVSSPGRTLKTVAFGLSSSFEIYPTEGAYLNDMPFVNTRSGRSFANFAISKEPVPLTDLNKP